MATSSLTTVAYIYKRLYSDDAVGDQTQRDHPLMKMMEKKGGFTGSAFHYGIRHGNPQGISATFADAQADVNTSKGLQLAMARFKKYGVIVLDGESMAAADGNKGAFLDLVTQETNGVLDEMGDHLSFDLYRDGQGSRGVRSSESSDVTTLTIADDARNFKIGMNVMASPNADGSSQRVGETVITSVDEDAGTIGLDTSAIAAYADSDYLFAHGDEALGAEGLAKLFPLTAPASGDSFRGIDRSVDPRRQAGIRLDDTGTSIEENAGLVAVKISQTGKKADCVMVNPINFWQVARRLNAKVEYAGGGGKADFGFEYISIHSPAGTLKLYSDADCPTNRGYVLNRKTLYIKHLKGFPHIIRDDGRPNLRQTSADAIEARVRVFWNVVCTQPGSNGVFSI